MRPLLHTFSLTILFFAMTLLLNAYAAPTTLQVTETNLKVNGKDSKVFSISQPDGTFGYFAKKGEMFDVIVENKTHVPLVLHWHGILSPNPDDGVPFVTQAPIQPNGSYHYQFKLTQSGTYWLHSHYKLQEQKLMAAPLIIYDPNETAKKEVIMFVQDFTFANPRQIFEDLRKSIKSVDFDQQLTMPMDQGKMMSMTADVNDVKFDAYLTNHRTLQDPEIDRVKPGDEIRLRVINASASSNYYLDLGKLTGTLIAIDGVPIKPIKGSRFQMAIGNRLDILIKMPATESAYPILALPEGTKQQTGLILATQNATIPKLAQTKSTVNPVLNYNQDLTVTPLQPLKSKPTQQTLVFNLEGDMQTYRWTMNNQVWPFVTPDKIKPGTRVEMVFKNKTMMEHPMHLHGHVFQIVQINGKKVNGRLGDTINVMPNSQVKVIFDADNAGIWMLHCHILYHQQGGMMTTINYVGYPEKFTTQQREEGAKLYNLSPF